jgi:predicted MFS family arabinose efflux permease
VALGVVIAVTVASCLTPAATSSVIRTLWRTVGKNDAQVKALHSYDSIAEELGFLAGPMLASILLLRVGNSSALYVVICASVASSVLVLISHDVRQALRAPVAREVSSSDVKISGNRIRRIARTVAGPIASHSLQRIVLPLILMGTVFGIVGILAPALCERDGHLGYTGFVMAAISFGGVIGAFVYSSMKLNTTLRQNHAFLGLIFAIPLTFAALANNPWALGALLAVAGLAVTPLYINSYLMMDKEVPSSEIHEANAWVPVGNDVGYVVGISLAAVIIGHNAAPRALVAVSCVAAVLLVYSLTQLIASRSQFAEQITTET